MNSSPVPTRDAELPVIDQRVLANLRALDDDGTFVSDLVEVFLTESPVRLAALQGLVTTRKFADVMSLAHALKSAARSLGLARMAEACEVVETAGREGRVPDRAALLELETRYASATGALEVVLQERVSR
jgi:HPt (histidine-containing phosphotransfer) domain-containing protein